MNKHVKTPQKELNKMEISNLPNAGFKTLVTRMLKNLVRTSTAQKRSRQKQGIHELKQRIDRVTTIEWMKLRIRSVIWNIRKQNTTNQNKVRKVPPKMRIA